MAYEYFSTGAKILISVVGNESDPIVRITLKHGQIAVTDLHIEDVEKLIKMLQTANKEAKSIGTSTEIDRKTKRQPY